MIKKASLVGLTCLLLAGGTACGDIECRLKDVRCEKTSIGKTDGIDSARGQCKKPAEGISFKNAESGENLFFQQVDSIVEGAACGWRFYKGNKDMDSPEIKITNLGDPLSEGLYGGIRVDYTHPEDDLDSRDTCKKTTWQGLYHTFRSYDCGYRDAYRCANLESQEGIKFLARGDGRLRIQFTEGYEGCVSFGEVYEYLVNLTETFQEYKIPFSEFSFRKDWQMGEEEIEINKKKGVDSKIVSYFLDCKFDTGIIQSQTIEGLCQDNDQKCRAGEKRYFEIKDIIFY